ncbi:hypothetical protein PM082_000060 [Marasmius tenuissimus]|nr:hypothetical protein PM082_000060 [Marasmius tenuissimus]
MTEHLSDGASSSKNLSRKPHWYPKSRKQRVASRDVQAFHANDPAARHEDIARHFQVSRSAVSKTLKRLGTLGFAANVFGELPLDGSPQHESPFPSTEPRSSEITICLPPPMEVDYDFGRADSNVNVRPPTQLHDQARVDVSVALETLEATLKPSEPAYEMSPTQNPVAIVPRHSPEFPSRRPELVRQGMRRVSSFPRPIGEDTHPEAVNTTSSLVTNDPEAMQYSMGHPESSRVTEDPDQVQNALTDAISRTRKRKARDEPESRPKRRQTTRGSDSGLIVACVIDSLALPRSSSLHVPQSISSIIALTSD